MPSGMVSGKLAQDVLFCCNAQLFTPSSCLGIINKDTLKEVLCVDFRGTKCQTMPDG